MSKLLFLKNLEELNYIKSNFKGLLTTHKIITFYSPPNLQLYSEGFSVESVSDYLLVQDYKKILKDARLLAKEWYKPFASLLNYRGVNLGEIVRIEQLYFFTQLISTYLCFKRIIAAHKPDEVALFAELDIPSLGIPRLDGTNDIPSAVIIWMCEEKQIPVHKLHLGPGFQKAKDRLWRRLNRKITRYVPLVLSFYRYLNKLVKKVIYQLRPECIRLNSIPRVPGKKLAVAIGNEFELFILKEVMETLSQTGDFNVLFLNLEADFINADRLKDRSGLDVDILCKTITLEDFSTSVIPERTGIISSLQEARRRLESGNVLKNESQTCGYLSLLNNPYLVFQFDFLWSNYFFDGVSIIDKIYNAYRRLNPDVVIVANAIGYCQRIFIKLASMHGIKSVTVPHGWVGDIDEYEFETDLFLAWGQLSKQQFIEEFNKSPSEIAVVGAIQFEKFIPCRRQLTLDIVKNIKEKFELRQDAKVVLIMAASLQASVFSVIDHKRFFEAWEAIKFFISQHPEIDFIIRPHPTCPVKDWYRKLVIDSNRPNLKIIEEAKIDSFLPAVDVGVLMGEPTTAGYLCILFGAPIVYFRGFSKSQILNTMEAWNEDNGILTADQEKHLTDLLEQLVNDDNFRKTTLEKQHDFIDKSLFIRDGKVGERIVQAVENLFN